MAEPSRIRRWILSACVLFLLGLGVPTFLLVRPALRDPEAFFSNRRSDRFEVRVDSTWTQGPAILENLTVSGFREGSTRPVQFSAYLSRPADAAGPLTAFVLAAGYRTGRRSIRFIGERPAIASRAIFLALDYPYTGQTTFKGLHIVPRLGEIRRSLFDGVEAMRLAIDVLEREKGVDNERIILLGASFGAFYAVDAGALDPRADAVIACMGGGGLAGLLDWNLRHGGYVRSRWISMPVGALAAVLIRPLEPMRLVDRISPRPYVQISATADARIPIGHARDLFGAAEDPKRLVWMQTEHVLPGLDEIIEEMIRLAIQEIERLGLLEK